MQQKVDELNQATEDANAILAMVDVDQEDMGVHMEDQPEKG